MISQNILSLLIDGQSYLAHIGRDRNKKYVLVGGHQFVVQEPQRVEKESAAAFSKGEEKGPQGNL